MEIMEMKDLLALPIRCDFCGKSKEMRYFAEVADEDTYFSMCKDCKTFLDKVDDFLADENHCSTCQCQTQVNGDLQIRQEKVAFAQEFYERHGE